MGPKSVPGLSKLIFGENAYLGGFCQNLGDSWQNIATENATAFAKNNVKKS